MLIWRAYDPPANCRGIAVIIATGYLDTLQGAACAGVPVVDRDLVRSGQAIAIRLQPQGVLIQADRDGRGRWPWLPPMAPPPE